MTTAPEPFDSGIQLPEDYQDMQLTRKRISNQKGPDYYRRGSIEVWDFICDQGLNFHLGNAIKYICRAGYKESKVEDLKKAIHYLENALEHATQRDESSAVRRERVQDTLPSQPWPESDFFEPAGNFDR